MKEKYAIPYTIDASFLNARAKLKDDKTGVGFDKKWSVRSILTFIGATVAYGWLVFKSSASKILAPGNGSTVGLILFTIGYVGLMYFGLREISIPQQFGYNVIAPLINYLQIRRHPELSTKRFDPYLNATRITGMLEPTDNGYERYTDGSYAIVYKISGNASYNTFSIDRRTSVDSFNQFLRNMPHKTTLSFITNTAGQKVDEQVTHLIDLLQDEHNISMMAFIQEEIRELTNYVRNNFFALHQYLIIRGDDETALKDADRSIKSFVKSNGSVINVLERLTPAEERNFFKSFFAGVEADQNHLIEEFSKQDHYKKSQVEMAGNRMADLNKEGKKGDIRVGNRRENSVRVRSYNRRPVQKSVKRPARQTARPVRRGRRIGGR